MEAPSGQNAEDRPVLLKIGFNLAPHDGGG
jgi:hypothetical protein